MQTIAFCVGESSFGSNGPDLRHISRAVIPRIPWDAGSTAVNDALKRAGVRHSRKNLAESTVVAYLDLPHEANVLCPLRLFWATFLNRRN